MSFSIYLILATRSWEPGRVVEAGSLEGAIPEVYEASRLNLKHQAFGRLRLRGQVDAWVLHLKPIYFLGYRIPGMVRDSSPDDLRMQA